MFVLFLIICGIAILAWIIKLVGIVPILLFLLSLIALAAIIMLFILKSASKDNKEYENYLKSPQGQKDVKALITKMKSLGIAVPNESNITPLSVEYYINPILDHYRKNFIPDGYSDIIDLGEVKLIYNKRFVLILPEKYTSKKQNYNISVTRTGIMYSSTVPGSEVHDLSSFFESLEKEYGQSGTFNNSAKIKIEDFYWRTEGGMSSTTSLCDTAASAVLGGIIAGPIGALAGGMHSRNKQKKEDKRLLVIGDRTNFNSSYSRRIIKEIFASYVDCDSAVKKLEEFFPDHKLPNLYY